MNFRTTAVLFVLLLLLGGGYVAMKRADESRDRRVEAAKRLFDFEATALQRVSVDRIDGAPVVGVQFAPGEWQIAEPSSDIRAANEVWNRVAQNFAGLINERALLGKVDDHALYGLAEPILEVRGELEGGDAIRLRFGGLEPTQAFRYAQLDNEMLFLVNSTQFHELNRDLDLLRHRFLVEDRSANLLRVEISHIWGGDETEEPVAGRAIGDESPPLVLQRENADAPWRMFAPIRAAVDQDKAEQIAAEIRGGIGRGFVDTPEHLGDYGLAPARLRITVLDDAEGERQTLLLGGEDRTGQGGIFAKHADRPAVFQIEPHLLTLIPAAPLDIRDRRMLTRPIGEATRIEYQWSAARFTLEQDPARGWMVTAPVLDDVDLGVVSWFLASLKNVQAVHFLEGMREDFGLEDPDVRIRIDYSGAVDPMTVRIKNRPDSTGEPAYYAVQQDSGDIMRIDTGQVRSLLLDATAFRSRFLFSFDRHQSVLLDLSFEGQPYLFEKVHGLWQVRSPENATLANQSDVERILDAVAQLEASGIERVDTGDDARYGLAEPRLALALTTAEEGSEKRAAHGPLRVGGLVADSLTERYARVAGREGVFRVSQDLMTTVRAALEGVRVSVENENPEIKDAEAL